MSDALQFLTSIRLPDLGEPDFTAWRHILMMVWIGIGITVTMVCVRCAGSARKKTMMVADRRKIPRILRQEGIERVREDLWWYLFALRHVKRYLPPNEVAQLPASMRLRPSGEGRWSNGVHRLLTRRTYARRSDAILIELERRITARKLKQAGGVIFREPAVLTTRAWSKRAVVVEKR